MLYEQEMNEGAYCIGYKKNMITMHLLSAAPAQIVCMIGDPIKDQRNDVKQNARHNHTYSHTLPWRR
jgi:hypothetical protein